MSALTVGLPRHVTSPAPRAPEALRVLRILVVAVGLHRALALTATIAGGDGIGPPAIAVTFTAAMVWGGVLVYEGWRRAAFPPRLAVLDVGFALAVGLLALAWGQSGMGFGYQLLQGAAIVAGGALPVAAAAAAVTALILTKSLWLLMPPHSGGITLSEFVAYAVTLAALAIAAAAANRLLRSAADAVDRRHADPPGRASDRAEQNRVLHDTALATLTSIANGALDARTDEVRARCARDATYLRLIMQGGQTRRDGPGLAAALAGAAAEAAAVGLRVHPTCDTLPPDLDPAVEAAIEMAVREALNNVHRHAHTGQAWLTAAEEGGRVVVRVVDRGRGFAPSRSSPGSGIRDSISARMREVGGAARVGSSHGEGTWVELRWPR